MNKTQQAVSVFDKLAALYETKFMDVSLYKEALDLLCLRLPPAATVLDVACGPGNMARYLLNQRPDLRLTGTDLAPQMLELARRNNPEAEFVLMDARRSADIGKRFHAILLSFCLPYLSKAEALQLIADCALLLEPGGLLYLSAMEADNSRSGYEKGSSGDEVYMNYHEAPYMLEALTTAGLSLVYEDRKTYEHNGKATCDLILIAQP